MIVIDPGHGGQRPAGRSTPFGHRGPDGALEKDVTLQLARLVAARVGAATSLTRTTDTNPTLADRAALARTCGARAFVSLHVLEPRFGAMGRAATVMVHPAARPRSVALAHAVRIELARAYGGDVAVEHDVPLAVLHPRRLGDQTAGIQVEVDVDHGRWGARSHLPAIGDAIARGIARYAQTAMKIAICVPCWNHLAYTKQFVDSVLRNSGDHDFGFVFVDNGSTDGTAEFLASVPRLARLICNSENRGVNPAWNQLLAAATSYGPEIIVLANNDVLCGPGWLDPIERELAKNDKRYFLPNGRFTDPVSFDADVRAALPSLRGTAPGRAGWCLSFHSSAVPLFHPIPDELKLWYGDDWIHERLAQHGYKCEVLLDSCCLHFESKSISDYQGLAETVNQDREAFERLMSS